MTRQFGLDLWDVAIQAALTLFTAFALSTALGSEGVPEEVVLAAVFGASVLVLGIRRHFALKGGAPPTTHEVQAARVEDLEQRVAELEAMAPRLAELEERLDFSERLLVQGRHEPVERPTPPG